MYQSVPVFVIADSGEHGNSESIPTLQTSLQIWHPCITLSVASAISMQAFYANKINIT